MQKPSEPQTDKKQPVVVKKYANRRLYNTETSVYVTLEDLATMVRGERDFVVYDAKTGDDLTHSVLTQIIVEQESRAGTETLLPVPFLRQLIRFYGDTMQRMVPSYLQVSLDTLTKDQDRFRKQFATAFTPHGAFEAYQEQARKNLQVFEQAMTMFTPFGAPTGAPKSPSKSDDQAPTARVAEASAPAASPSPTPSPAPATAPSRPAPAKAADAPAVSGDIAELKAQLAAMQAKLERLAQSGKN